METGWESYASSKENIYLTTSSDAAEGPWKESQKSQRTMDKGVSLSKFGAIEYEWKCYIPLASLSFILSFIFSQWLKRQDSLALGDKGAIRGKESSSHHLQSDCPQEPLDQELSCRTVTWVRNILLFQCSPLLLCGWYSTPQTDA